MIIRTLALWAAFSAALIAAYAWGYTHGRDAMLGTDCHPLATEIRI